METLDKHFRKLTQPVFQKHGFAQGDVLANWPQIVGEQVAAISTPEKIRWPRGAGEKSGGTLHLKVQAGRALDVQYQAAGIIERINRFLGYPALSALKVLHVHDFFKVAKVAPARHEPSAAVWSRVAPVTDPDLQAALARLGAGVAATRSPQAK